MFFLNTKKGKLATRHISKVHHGNFHKYPQQWSVSSYSSWSSSCPSSFSSSPPSGWDLSFNPGDPSPHGQQEVSNQRLVKYIQSQLLDSCRAMTPSVTLQAIDKAFSDLIACGIFTETEPGSSLYKITLQSECRKRLRSIRSLDASEIGMNI